MNSVRAAARKYGRIPGLLLLSLLILTMSGFKPAHADGVATGIGNGQIKYGNISYYTNYDTYTFSVPAGGYIMASIGETGAHDSHFEMYLELDRPNGTTFTWAGGYYNTSLEAGNAVAGTWTLYVSRGDAFMTGGNYEVQAYVVPGAASVSGGSAGGMMVPSVTYAGTIVRGDTGYFNFNGLSGGNWTVNLAATGGSGFQPWIRALKPDATNAGTTWTSSSGSIAGPAVTGNYTVVLAELNYNWSSTGTYTLQLTGPGSDLPNNAKQDGYCSVCQQNALAAKSGEVSSTEGVRYFV